MGDFGAGEERRRGVGAHGDAGAAADAGGRVHGALGVLPAHYHGVAVGGAAGGDGDVPAGGDNSVEGGAVHHEVLDHGECLGSPGFEVELVAILEVTHMELAEGGAGERAVGHAVHHAAAHAANAFRSEEHTSELQSLRHLVCR